ncbi:hypothetical protein MICRO11B_200105 [Micrococcus luteus]|nr:hypothetical protein MICRO11B_200105 [Micrococcus luteus]
MPGLSSHPPQGHAAVRRSVPTDQCTPRRDRRAAPDVSSPRMAESADNEVGGWGLPRTAPPGFKEGLPWQTPPRPRPPSGTRSRSSRRRWSPCWAPCTASTTWSPRSTGAPS